MNKYYSKPSVGGEWTETTFDRISAVINSHFEEQPFTRWDGSQAPSRQMAWDRINSGETLYTYAAQYKMTKGL